MSKIAFVFPGQGAQYTGMAKDFYEKYAVSREVFESASKASGLDVKALCFEENDRLNITEYTQIAMLTAEIAILRAVEEAGIRSQVNAGLSLGEYGALVASGVMKEEDAFTVVRKRGIFMQHLRLAGVSARRLAEKPVRRHRDARRGQCPAGLGRAGMGQMRTVVNPAFTERPILSTQAR